MQGLEQVYAALREAILERYPRSVTFGGGDPFVAFDVGMPIPDETFRLDDPARTLSRELAVEFLSHQSNTVPAISGSVFQRTGRTVEEQYGLILAGAQPSDADMIELFGFVRGSAQERFDHTLGSLVGPYRYRPVLPTPLNWYDPAAVANWSHLQISQHDSPPPHPPHIDPRLFRWKIAPESIRTRLDRPVRTEIFRDVREAAATHGSVESSREPLGGGGWLSSTHGHVETGAHSTLEEARSSGIFVGGVEGTASGGAHDGPSSLGHRALIDFSDVGAFTDLLTADTGEEPVAADRFTLDAEMCIVEFSREWLSRAFLSLPGWYVPGYRRGEMSSGAGGDEGNFSVLPTTCILIRNVTIEANWTEGDVDAIAGSSHLGSFSLLGRSFDRNSLTLTIPGMQSFAWVCEPMPLLPPFDSP